MLLTLKLVLILTVLLVDIRPADADAARRDLNGQQPPLEFLHLGHFGSVARLPSHPAFASLALTPQQATGFLTLLLHNNLLAPHALTFPDGRLLPGTFPPHFPNICLPPLGFPINPPFDPYLLLLMTNYSKFLPYGLGPHGFFGSTGLPQHRPSPLLRYTDKN